MVGLLRLGNLGGQGVVCLETVAVHRNLLAVHLALQTMEIGAEKVTVVRANKARDSDLAYAALFNLYSIVRLNYQSCSSRCPA